jgi:hypothetical protein
LCRLRIGRSSPAGPEADAQLFKQGSKDTEHVTANVYNTARPPGCYTMIGASVGEEARRKELSKIKVLLYVCFVDFLLIAP